MLLRRTSEQRTKRSLLQTQVNDYAGTLSPARLAENEPVTGGEQQS